MTVTHYRQRFVTSEITVFCIFRQVSKAFLTGLDMQYQPSTGILRPDAHSCESKQQQAVNVRFSRRFPSRLSFL